MKKIIIIIFLACCAGTLAAQYAVDTQRIKSAYDELVKNPNSRKCQENFFNAFPNSWEKFLRIYNFYPKDDLTMYYLGHDHIINGLGKRITLLPDSTYCDKLIRLSVGGRWDADAPTYLQTILWDAMQNKTEVMFQRLSLLWEGNVFPFWYFFFHSLLNTKENVAMFNYLKIRMQEKYPSIVKDMEIAFPVSSGKASIPVYK